MEECREGTSPSVGEPTSNSAWVDEAGRLSQTLRQHLHCYARLSPDGRTSCSPSLTSSANVLFPTSSIAQRTRQQHLATWWCPTDTTPEALHMVCVSASHQVQNERRERAPRLQRSNLRSKEYHVCSLNLVHAVLFGLVFDPGGWLTPQGCAATKKLDVFLNMSFGNQSLGMSFLPYAAMAALHTQSPSRPKLARSPYCLI